MTLDDKIVPMEDLKPKHKQPYTVVHQRMHKIGVVFWLTGCIRFHKDGDGFNGVFRAWHPLTWLLGIVAIVPCALFGIKLSEAIPLRLSEFWKQNAAQLQWVTPWTKLATLKPFNSALRHVPEDERITRG
jgi:hypothetical protein